MFVRVARLVARDGDMVDNLLNGQPVGKNESINAN